jgi:hypothetical protein
MADSNAAMTNAVAAGHARYTLWGGAAAEARVVQDLSRLATGIDSEVGDALRALVLAGPFARGEGSVAMHDGEPRAQDPGYQLLTVFKHNPERRQRALDMMAATWSRLLGARVAIHALGVRDLSRAPATCFWFHAGRRQLVTLAGDPRLVSSIPRTDAADLRSDEAAYVLCDSLSALALVTLGTQDARGDVQAVAAMQRAVLACGDALLLIRGQYADTLRARAEALDNVCNSAALRAGYRDAIEWTARPDMWQPEMSDVPTWLASARRWLAAAYLEAEAMHLGSARDLIGYLDHPAILYVDGADGHASRSYWPHLLRRGSPDVARIALPALDRLLRSSVALAFGAHLPACRQRAAALLRLPPMARSSATDTTLALSLRALARTTLYDPKGHPFSNTEPEPTPRRNMI